MLSDSESESDHGQDPLHQITINEHYAKAFEYKKEREELQRLKEQYGSDPDSSEEEETDSEELESEDSDGEELTPAVDAAILRTLARIKRKDPGIYEEGKNIFGEEQEKTTQSAKVALTRPTGVAKESRDKAKPFTMRDANIQSALLSRSASPDGEEPAPVTHVEEQRRLRDETIAAFHAAAEEEADDFLVPREKTLEESAREEAEYRQFLEKEVGDVRALVDVGGVPAAAPAQEDDADADVEGDGKKKEKKKKQDGEQGGEDAGRSKHEEDQDFLVNYILNRGWIDRSSKRVPTYGEVTSQSKKGKAKAQPADDATGSGGDDETDEEEVFDDIVDRFESSYNFRFEETEGTEIKSYPRNLPSLVRREDTTRKDARERRKQRKEEELAKRKEEVRRLKGLKVKEIRARLERAGVATGDAQTLEELGIDLDAPWDPEAHDRQMAGLYALNGGDEEDVDPAEFEDDGEKPTWGEEVDMGDIRMSPEAGSSRVEKKKKKKKKKKGGEEEDAGVDVDAMDADAVRAPGDDDEEWDGTEEMRKRKLDEWMDEVYALDFNDLVGGMPTRFHYASVAPQTFALTPVEILLAKDSELNEYMSVKKYAPYRADNKAGWDHTRVERLREFKGKVKERMGGIGIHVEQPGRDGQVKKKRKGKKERMKEKGVEGADADVDASEVAPLQTNGAEDSGLKRKRDEDEEPAAVDPGQPSEGGKKKRRRKKKDSAVDTEAD
ncbi:Krr1-domain-containing protein [Mycena filopes]|nr:Krr1-domain-containing protein [Mycena filopes]